jgi:serine/threonine-protein kinase
MGVNPTPIERESVNPSPSETYRSSPTPTPTPIAPTIQPKMPPQLARQGVNYEVYDSAVKQIFRSQNSDKKITKENEGTQAKLDEIGDRLGTQLVSNLRTDSLNKLGKYSPADAMEWRSQINKLHLSERTLIDLTDTKYDHITEYSAEELGIKFKQFIKSPMGQVYLATMHDRVQAIKTRSALEEIVFPKGGTSGTVKGTLQPGEGKAFIASLFGGQDINIKINADRPSYLAIYPPTSKLPAMLKMTETNNWSGKTRINGYHEFILIGDGEKPLNYELTLTATDLPPPDR